MAKTTDQTDAEILLDNLDPASKPARDGRVVRAIAELVDQRNYLDAHINDAVHTARAAGHSWGHIATALGVSRQAARQRFTQASDSGLCLDRGLP